MWIAVSITMISLLTLIWYQFNWVKRLYSKIEEIHDDHLDVIMMKDSSIEIYKVRNEELVKIIDELKGLTNRH